MIIPLALSKVSGLIVTVKLAPVAPTTLLLLLSDAVIPAA